MFTLDQRARLRSDLLDRAASDPRIVAAAITGSAATGSEDEWSDIDLAFAIDSPAEMPAALADWTAHIYNYHSALHHTDVNAGAWVYRVFLFPSTLQVDLAFVPAGEFRPLAPSFRLAFGESREPQAFPQPGAEGLIGLGWLYAIHVRSSLARGRLWQAEYMVSGLRDHALALACIRRGLPTQHGRGIDRLPLEVVAQFEESLVRELNAHELSRAFRVAVEGFLHEIKCADGKLAERLEPALRELAAAP